jgi:MEMO1 family protein
MKLAIIFLGLLACGIMPMESSSTTIRQPAVSGQFYPSDIAKLRQEIRADLDRVTNLPAIDGHIIALLVPHAGYVYSGPVAAYSYRLLEQSHYNKVVICGPSHRYPFIGLSVYGSDIAWRTPLGLVNCNSSLCKQLVGKYEGIDLIPAAHMQEHSIEVQLPFLQTVLHDFSLVPIVMGNQDHSTIKILADALTALPFDDSTVMIASSDWQHYMPASEGWKFDSLGLDCIQKLDFDRLEKYLAEDKTQMCGGGPAVAVFKAAIAKGANRVKILKYGDSGDMTGDKSSVVSYVAAVLYKSDKPEAKVGPLKKAKEPETGKRFLSETDKQTLLKIARHSIETYLATQKIPDFTVSDSLKLPGAAFVTLEVNGQLRGCIGQTAAITPLYETIAHCAVSAAVEDYRFDPVTPAELPDIHIEISVLTPLQKVNSLDEIVVGRDGLLIGLGSNRGLLLPQVATEQHWDKTEFLEGTCHKAGLIKDAYKDPRAEIYKFQAIIFGE